VLRSAPPDCFFSFGSSLYILISSTGVALARGLNGANSVPGALICRSEEASMKKFSAEVVPDRADPRSWRVEKINSDDDGAVDIAIFSGPSARERATEYAAWKYGEYEVRSRAA
jgi:hypothetical protein